MDKMLCIELRKKPKINQKKSRLYEKNLKPYRKINK